MSKKPEKMDAEEQYLRLTLEEAKQVLEYLASQPYRDVFQLINMITQK